MDRKSMEAAHIVKGMTDQHFDGGFYSEEVREQSDAIKDLSEAEKQALYVEIFKKAMALVQEIAEHPRYNDDLGDVDLTAEGIGVIHISAGYQERDGSFPAYSSIEVHVESFDPVDEEYRSPIDFEDGIYLNGDGTIQDHEMPLDPKIIKAIDFLETLDTVKAALKATEVPA